MLKQMIVRVDDDLHRKIKAMAALEGKSITVLVSELLEQYLEEKNSNDGEKNAQSPTVI